MLDIFFIQLRYLIRNDQDVKDFLAQIRDNGCHSPNIKCTFQQFIPKNRFRPIFQILDAYDRTRIKI